MLPEQLVHVRRNRARKERSRMAYRDLCDDGLGDGQVFGLLALGSEDAERFYAEMGTVYLRRIGELCAAGVAARL